MRIWNDPSIGMIVKILQHQGLAGLEAWVRIGEWIVFPEVSNNYFQEQLEEYNFNNKIRTRIAVNIVKSNATIQKMRESGLDHYGFSLADRSSGGGKESDPYLYYDYTLWEAVGSLNVNLDLYLLYERPLDLLKGYDLIVPDYADFYVAGEEKGGFSFVDGLLEDARRQGLSPRRDL